MVGSNVNFGDVDQTFYAFGSPLDDCIERAHAPLLIVTKTIHMYQWQLIEFGVVRICSSNPQVYHLYSHV